MANAGRAAKAEDRDTLRLEEELSDSLGATVKIAANRKGALRVAEIYGLI